MALLFEKHELPMKDKEGKDTMMERYTQWVIITPFV